MRNGTGAIPARGGSTPAASMPICGVRSAPDAEAMSKFLIVLGVVLIVLGLLWELLGRLGLGRLPGDIVIERDGLHVYIPLATSILLSVVLSLVLTAIFWWLNR